MWIFLLSFLKLIFVHFLGLYLSTIVAKPRGRGTDTGVRDLPITVARPEGSGTDMGVRNFPTTAARPEGSDTGTSEGLNHEVAERFDGTTNIGSRAAFLGPTYIIKSIQNAYFPSVKAFAAPKPSSSEFWEKKAKEYEKILQGHIPCLLRDATTYFKSTTFTDIASNMHHIVSATATFRANIKGPLDARNITFDALTEELEAIFMKIVNDLKNIPPPDKVPSHAEREETVDKILDSTTLALVQLAARYGIEEEVVKDYLRALNPCVRALIVAVGDINEHHPNLLPTITFSVTVLLIPESWILRPFLSMFGFGPEVPIKGSAAALLQSHIWGAAVKPGSWFPVLQRAGMGLLSGCAWLVTKVRLVVGAVLALRRPNRG